MAKLGKWIGGGLGWVVGGPIGALLGFAVGSFFDGASNTPNTQQARTRMRTTQGDFVMSLLVLIAAVMKADGKVTKSELDYVKAFFKKSFGETAAKEAVLTLRDILKQDIPVDKVGWQIKQNMDYAARLQLLHVLFGLSKADGQISKAEINTIHYISNRIGVTTHDENSIKAMFVEETNSAYKILEIEKSASDDDVKKAYYKMAKKHHPDKVSHLGEEIQNKANEKFQEINKAFEKIKKERGII